MLKIKKQFHLSWRQTLALISLVALVVVSHLAHTPAQTVIQGYNTDEKLQTGMIVALSPTDASKVVAVKAETTEQMRGVIVDPSDAAVSLSSPNQKVFVASTGRFNVLVSNQNGNVHSGDYISISSLPGIGMKARGDQKLVIGRAAANLDTNNALSTTTIQDATHQQVAIGKVAVDIGVMNNPSAGTGNSNLPTFLQSAGNSVAGKNVSPGKIYLGAALLLMCGIISGSMLYAGVRSGIVSIGRNPLSKASIIRSLIQVVVTSLIIFIGGLFGVYLLLKL